MVRQGIDLISKRHLLIDSHPLHHINDQLHLLRREIRIQHRHKVQTLLRSFIDDVHLLRREIIQIYVCFLHCQKQPVFNQVIFIRIQFFLLTSCIYSIQLILRDFCFFCPSI